MYGFHMLLGINRIPTPQTALTGWFLLQKRIVQIKFFWDATLRILIDHTYVTGEPAASSVRDNLSSRN
jgi:hypothetical protein